MSPNSLDTNQPDTGPDIERARNHLYRRFFRNTDPPPWREPSTDQGRDRMDADVLRLAELAVMDVITDMGAFVDLLEIGDFQGWT